MPRAKASSEAPDTLIPDPVVAQEFGVTLMTVYRWSNDPTMGFPPKIQIRTRNYRRRRDIDAFKKRMFEKAVAAHDAA